MKTKTEEGGAVGREFAETLAAASKSNRLTKEQIITLLEATPGTEEAGLYHLADQVRREYLGDAVHLRGIIEFSSYCRNDCHYCGLRRSNNRIARYRIPPAEIVATAAEAAAMGYRTIVLQSGEDPFYTGADLAEIISLVKAAGDFAVTVCVGERSRQDYRLMREAGADRYLLKHETADPVLFARMRPGTTLAGRRQRLQWLKELGYQVGSGNIVGLPGQTTATMADDLLLMQELDVEMAGIGPFIPHGQTPLKDYPAGTVAQTLRCLAVARLLMPATHLPATTALGTMDPGGRQQALNCGANVIMPNISPAKYRQLYQIYPNKAGSRENAEASHYKIISMIKEVGRFVSHDRGDSPTVEGFTSRNGRVGT